MATRRARAPDRDYIGARQREIAMFMFGKKAEMPAAADALPGRANPIPTAAKHFVNGRALKGPYPEGLETAMFGLGCFWGAERMFWKLDGVYVTAVGYAGGLLRARRHRRELPDRHRRRRVSAHSFARST